MHRTIISFAPVDRYDPKQALEHPQCVSKIFFKKILESQSQEDHPPKLSFWRSTMQFCIKIEKSPLYEHSDGLNGYTAVHFDFLNTLTLKYGVSGI